MKSEHEKLHKCRMCEQTFPKICELETHIMDSHEYKPFECTKCDKTFVLKWRLTKHRSGHETEFFCHYYNNEKECPFDKVGCKFRHEISPFCMLVGYSGQCSVVMILLGFNNIRKFEKMK